MFNRILFIFSIIFAFQHQTIVGEYNNFNPEDVTSIRDKLFVNIANDERALLDSAHPVMVLAVNKCNQSISNIIEKYLQVFDPVLLSDETCSKTLRGEAWKFLRRVSNGGFYCLNQLNSQILATSRNQEYVPLSDCLGKLEKDSVEKLKSFSPTVKLCSYFLAIPLQSVNLDPTGITKAIHKARLNQA